MLVMQCYMTYDSYMMVPSILNSIHKLLDRYRIHVHKVDCILFANHNKIIMLVMQCYMTYDSYMMVPSILNSRYNVQGLCKFHAHIVESSKLFTLCDSVW